MVYVAAEPSDRRPLGPLTGIRILALEQMQALPFATQLLARLGADVVKVEPPGGEMGRSSQPSVPDPDGRAMGATFLRNNLGKRSICIDLKNPAGRQLVLDMAPHFDVIAENFRAGAMSRLGLGFEDMAAANPHCVYLSVSGFGNLTASPYRDRMAFAPIVEAMSGIYAMKQKGNLPPEASPVGGLGDISAALFASVGLLAALRERDRTAQAQYVDVAMLDCVLAMTDIVSNFWSMGLKNGDVGPLINNGFRAGDGWIIVQVTREHYFERLADIVGQPEWKGDERLATRQGWVDHLEDMIRPALERWAADKTREQACSELGAAGIAAGPCLRDEELVDDPHVLAHDMLVGFERPQGGGGPILTPGNPVRIHTAPGTPDTRVPWAGEDTDGVLTNELGLSAERVAELRASGVVA